MICFASSQVVFPGTIPPTQGNWQSGVPSIHFINCAAAIPGDRVGNGVHVAGGTVSVGDGIGLLFGVGMADVLEEVIIGMLLEETFGVPFAVIENILVEDGGTFETQEEVTKPKSIKPANSKANFI